MIPSIQPLEARRLWTTYAPDVTWGGAGQLGDPSDGPPPVYVRDGRIVTLNAYGYDQDEMPPSTTVGRYNAEGQEDRRFKPLTTRDVPDLVGVDAAARPLIAEGGTGAAVIRRYKPAGGFDRSFYGNVRPPDAAGKPVSVDGVDVTPAGDLLAVVRVDGLQRKAKDRTVTRYVARFRGSDGLIDPAFGVGGYVRMSEATAGSTYGIVHVAADRRGRVYASIDGPDGMPVYRLRANGSRDAAVGDRGLFVRAFPDFGFLLDAAGNVLLPWVNDSYYNLARVRPDGTFDDAFAANNHRFLDEARLDGELYAVLPQPDGTIYVQTAETLRRLNADGTPDRTFGDNGAIDLARIGDDDGLVIAALPGGRFLRRSGNRVYALAPRTTAALGTGGLFVTGTDGDDSVAVRTNGNVVRVSVNGEVFRFPAAEVPDLMVDLGDGDDVFTSTANVVHHVYGGRGRDRLTVGNVAGYSRNELDGGDGDDVLTGGGGFDLLFGGPGSDSLYGLAGDDELYAEDDDRDASARNLLEGGKGRDSAFRVNDDDTLVGIEAGDRPRR